MKAFAGKGFCGICRETMRMRIVKTVFSLLCVWLMVACPVAAGAEECADMDCLAPLAEQGDAAAQYRLGALYQEQGDELEAQRWYEAAGEQGNLEAQLALGWLYYNYMNPEAFEIWFTLAAEQGSLEAQLKLATAYYEGMDLEQDYAKAAKWFHKAAEQGDGQAYFSLGEIYRDGLGVESDPVAACMWFELAAAEGREEAPAQVKLLKDAMTPEQIGEADQLAGEWKVSPEN